MQKLDASFEEKRMRQLPFRCSAGSSSSQLQCLPDCAVVDVANYLDVVSVRRLGASCRHGRLCTSSQQVWAWRPLDLSYVRTLAEWQGALLSGLKSPHWSCATTVIAPSAKAIRVSHEFLAVFRLRMKTLDLRAVHHIAVASYLFMLRTRRTVCEEDRLERIVLPAPTVLEAKLDRFTQRTLARYMNRRSRLWLLEASEVVG